MTSVVERSPFRPGSLLDALRGATRASHAAVEEATDLLGPRCSIARYGRFLRGTLSVVEPIEARLVEELGDLVRAPRPSTRAERLRHDLQVLGVNPNVPAARPAVAIQGAADAFGAAYVLQGSLLGGTVIVPALRQRIELPETATTYLRLLGDDTGAAWRAFAVALDAFAAHAAAPDRQRVIDTATAAFDAFVAAFAREDLTA